MKKDYSKLKCFNTFNPIKVLFRDKKYSIETYMNNNNKISNVIVFNNTFTYYDNYVSLRYNGYHVVCDTILPNYICQKFIKLALKPTEGIKLFN